MSLPEFGTPLTDCPFPLTLEWVCGLVKIIRETGQIHGLVLHSVGWDPDAKFLLLDWKQEMNMYEMALTV